MGSRIQDELKVGQMAVPKDKGSIEKYPAGRCSPNTFDFRLPTLFTDQGGRNDYFRNTPAFSIKSPLVHFKCILLFYLMLAIYTTMYFSYKNFSPRKNPSH